MNIELLNRIKTAILAEPRAFDMNDWVAFDGEHVKIYGQACGTVCCIAGYALVLSGISPADFGNIPVDTTATRLLELGPWQSVPLFHTPGWPEELAEDYSNAWWSPTKRAEIAAKRIDAFIAEYYPEYIAAPALEVMSCEEEECLASVG